MCKFLSGMKTQARHLVRIDPRFSAFAGTGPAGDRIGYHFTSADLATVLTCPFGDPGDRLWMREVFRLRYDDDLVRYEVEFRDGHRCAPGPDDTDALAACIANAKWQRAPDAKPDEEINVTRGWFPPVCMPRAAARLELELTDVRVQRLQDISEADACAEGFGSPITRDCKGPKFAAAWEEQYGPKAWAANPWVWALSFAEAPAKGKEQADAR